MMRNVFQLFSHLLILSAGVRHARLTIVLASVTGLIAGFGSTALVAVINASLAARGHADVNLIGLFVILCILVPVSGFISQVLLVRLAAHTASGLRSGLAQRILNAPYRLQEELGSERLLAALTDDIPNVTMAVCDLPLLIMQLGIMAGCLVYLGWLSRPLLLVLLAYMALGILSHKVPMRKSVA